MNTNKNQPSTIPVIEDRWLCENFEVGKAIEPMTYPWLKYVPKKHGFPVPEDLRMPDRLILVVQKQKEIVFDYYRYKENLLVVSEPFLKFLDGNGVGGHFERAGLSIVHKKGSPLEVSRKYFLIRFGVFDDDKFVFDRTTAVRPTKDEKDFLLYPGLQFKEGVKPDRELFFLQEFCYRGFPVFTGSVKMKIESEFYHPEIYGLQEFPKVYKQQFNAPGF
jgi:Immunity protein 43